MLPIRETEYHIARVRDVNPSFTPLTESQTCPSLHLISRLGLRSPKEQHSNMHVIRSRLVMVSPVSNSWFIIQKSAAPPIRPAWVLLIILLYQFTQEEEEVAKEAERDDFASS